MLDGFSVFSEGGVVLFEEVQSSEASALRQSLAQLIRGDLLSGQGQRGQFSVLSHTFFWERDIKSGLVFVAMFLRQSKVSYGEELVSLCRLRFSELYEVQLRTLASGEQYCFNFSAFDETVQKFMRGLQLREQDAKAAPAAPMRSFEDTDRGAGLKERAQSTLSKAARKKLAKKQRRLEAERKQGKTKNQTQSTDDATDEDSLDEEDRSETHQQSGNDDEDDVEEQQEEQEEQEDAERELTRAERIQRLKQRTAAGGSGSRRRPGARRSNKASAAGPSPASSSSSRKGKGKKQRDWGNKLSKEELSSLERGGSVSDISRLSAAEIGKFNLDDLSTIGDTKDDDLAAALEVGDILQRKAAKEEAQASRGFFAKYLPVLTNRVLVQDDLKDVMTQFKNHLMSKNVASSIADELCNSVANSLVGQQLGSFTRVATVVREALEKTLTRILTPKRNIDILRDARAANASGRPYSMVFVGVNGVGKSTSLSKVCSWLMQNDFRVLIAACDTFRSGAVEQLNVHAKRLGAPLFSRGYGKNAGTVAMEAIREAKDTGRADVVLIDTAGRMHNNEKYMLSLGNLVQMNRPDLVLFVGEALVGNDAVDQLLGFNRALADAAIAGKEPRLVDGIVLTKFDTIDDKVGAALSMVYTTGAPICFVGTGQHYTDLKKMDVGAVVRALLR